MPKEFTSEIYFYGAKALKNKHFNTLKLSSVYISKRNTLALNPKWAMPGEEMKPDN